MKRIVLILLFTYSVASAELVQVPIYEISDNPACNYFFSLIFFMFLIVTPSKIVLQILWDYASHRKVR
jgi:hypothetical protein